MSKILLSARVTQRPRNPLPPDYKGVNRLMHYQPSPGFYALQLAQQKALSPKWIARLMRSIEIRKEQLTWTAAHPAVSRKGPIEPHLARIIHVFEDAKSLLVVQSRCARGFETNKEAFACPNIR